MSVKPIPKAGILLLILIATYALLTPVLFRLAELPFDSDEAVHALDGVRIAADIYYQDLSSLFNHLYFSQWYPPLLPTYLAPFFLTLGPTLWSSRYPILLLAMVHLALIFRVSKDLTNRPAAGLVTALLTATSPFLWIQSLVCMEEMLAMVGALASILAYVYVERQQLRPFWIGVVLAFTLLTKLPIGVYTSAGIFLAIGLAPGKMDSKLRLTWRAFAPLLAVAAVWWAHPAKIQDTISYLQASPPAYESLGWQELTHFWSSMLTTYTVSPLAGALVLGSIGIAFLRWRDPEWRAPLAVLLVTWLAMVFKRQLNIRFFVSGVPVAFLLAGNSVSEYGPLLAQWLKARKMAVLYYLLVFVLLGGSFLYLGARVIGFPFLMEVAYETDTSATAIVSWVEDRVPRGTSVFLVNGWDQLSTSALGFHLHSARWPDPETPDAVSVSLEDPEEYPQAVPQFERALISHSKSYVVHLGNTPVPNAGAWWAYQPVLEACWSGDWFASRSFWIGVWDGGLKEDILSHPFFYAREANRESARSDLLYPLSVEVRVALCEIWD
jgi:hypothetical protein